MYNFLIANNIVSMNHDLPYIGNERALIHLNRYYTVFNLGHCTGTISTVWRQVPVFIARLITVVICNGYLLLNGSVVDPDSDPALILFGWIRI